MINSEYLKWIVPSIKNRSVVHENEGFIFRIEKAKEQFKLPVFGIEDVVGYINEFLHTIGMKKWRIIVEKPKENNLRWFEYTKYNKSNIEDIVWIKFSKIDSENNIISVIGTSCDIFFTEKAKKTTSAGIINNKLNLEWNEEIVLIITLDSYPEGLEYLNRSDIESGIGNYLISKNVPILDYYSHNY